jgi:3-hydroxybutyryl-CoA dehydratase
MFPCQLPKVTLMLPDAPTPHQARTVFLEDLEPEQAYSRSFIVTAAVIDAYAAVSQDFNPLHVDEAYAATSPFKGRIAHGMLLAGYISATLGEGLPGLGSVYVSQSLNFKRAVRPGDEVEVVITVKAVDPKSGHVTLSTVVKIKHRVYVDGEAVVIAPRKPVA